MGIIKRVRILSEAGLRKYHIYNCSRSDAEQGVFLPFVKCDDAEDGYQFRQTVI